MVDRCRWTGNECDALVVTMDLRIIDLEVKISRSDLKADAKKDKWWKTSPKDWALRPDGTMGAVDTPDKKLTWPPKVWKHYYVMPRDIWRPELEGSLPSEASGILLVSEQQVGDTPYGISLYRRAKPNRDAEKLLPQQVMDIARLANIRMWDAYDMKASAQETQACS